MGGRWRGGESANDHEKRRPSRSLGHSIDENAVWFPVDGFPELNRLLPPLTRAAVLLCTLHYNPVGDSLQASTPARASSTPSHTTALASVASPSGGGGLATMTAAERAAQRQRTSCPRDPGERKGNPVNQKKPKKKHQPGTWPTEQCPSRQPRHCARKPPTPSRSGPIVVGLTL